MQLRFCVVLLGKPRKVCRPASRVVDRNPLSGLGPIVQRLVVFAFSVQQQTRHCAYKLGTVASMALQVPGQKRGKFPTEPGSGVAVHVNAA